MPRLTDARQLLRHSYVGIALCCVILDTHAEPESPLYLYGTPTGCLVRVASPLRAAESLRWSGRCDKEFATGEGALSIMEAGQIKRTSTGLMERGIPTGAWADGSPVTQAKDQPAATQPALADDRATIPATVVFFDFGSARLTTQACQLLQGFSMQLATVPSDSRFRIVGHADAKGTRKSIDKISKDRADAVRVYLIDKGVAPARLMVEARGDTERANPAVPFAPENRRVSLEPVLDR